MYLCFYNIYTKVFQDVKKWVSCNKTIQNIKQNEQQKGCHDPPKVSRTDLKRGFTRSTIESRTITVKKKIVGWTYNLFKKFTSHCKRETFEHFILTLLTSQRTLFGYFVEQNKFTESFMSINYISLSSLFCIKGVQTFALNYNPPVTDQKS